MSGKSRQHAACHSLETTWCSPGRSILDHLFSVHCHHAKTSTGMILACWRPRWRPRGGWGSIVQWRHLSRWTVHGAQHAPVEWPHSLSAAHCRPGVEPPCTCSSFKPRGPPATGPINVQSRELTSRWTAEGLSTSQPWGPHPLLAAFCSPVSSSLHVHVPDPKLLL